MTPGDEDLPGGGGPLSSAPAASNVSAAVFDQDASSAADLAALPDRPASEGTTPNASGQTQLLAAVWSWEMLRLPRRCIARFSAINGKGKALAMAGEAFMVVVPLLILFSSIGGVNQGGERAASAFISRFHLSGTAAQAVRELFQRPPGVEGTVSIVGILVLLLSLLTLTRQMRGVFEEAWRLEPARGVRATLHGLSGVGLFVAQVIVLGFIAAALVRTPAGTVTGTVVRLAVSFGCWLVLVRLLLSHRVSWRRLVPSAVLAAIGQSVLSRASAVYLPHLISRDASRYGLIGVTLAILSWIIVVCTVIVIEAIVGAELDRLRYNRGVDSPTRRSLLGSPR